MKAVGGRATEEVECLRGHPIGLAFGQHMAGRSIGKRHHHGWGGVRAKVHGLWAMVGRILMMMGGWSTGESHGWASVVL